MKKVFMTLVPGLKLLNMSRIKRKPDFAYAVTAQLISTLVFATGIVQFLFFLNP